MDTNKTKNEGEEVTVVLSGALSLTKKISYKKAAEIALFLADENNSAPENRDQVLLNRTDRPRVGGSAIEVIKASNAKTFPQQIVALACYVTQRNQTEFFDPKEVQLLLRRMGNQPQNFGRDLMKATDVFGYLLKEGPGQYIVTEKGMEMVSSGFEGANEGAPRRRGPHKKKKAKSADE